MIEAVFEVKVNKDKIVLGFIEGRKAAECRGKILFSLEDLVKCAFFRGPVDLSTFMEVSNFFFGGMDFLPIKDISSFQLFYEKQLTEEEKTGQPLLRQYGHFDVQCMHPPIVKEGKFIGFLQSTAFGIPYKLTCDYPYRSASCTFSYELLPFIHDVYNSQSK